MAFKPIRVEWEGLDEFEQMMKDYPDRVLHAAEAALYVEAEQIMTAAKKITPVDEGVLRSSGHVQLPVVTDDRVMVQLGFGGPAGTGNQGETNTKDVGYAVYVHEDLTAYHPVGQAKYLETPINARKSSMPERIARRMRRRLDMI